MIIYLFIYVFYSNNDVLSYNKRCYETQDTADSLKNMHRTPTNYNCIQRNIQLYFNHLCLYASDEICLCLKLIHGARSWDDCTVLKKYQ